MAVDRIVPNLRVADVGRAHRLYAEVFDLSLGMDLGWLGNLRAADTPTAQLQVMTRDATAPCNPDVSVGVTTVAEVETIHDRAVAAGLEIVHPLTDEEWGVRRFFFRDSDGNEVNVVAHP